MLKSFRALREYYTLAGVKKYLLIFEFITFLIPSVLSIISPVLLANAISSLTVYDFSKAIFELSLNFSIIIITALLYFVYHLISNKTTKVIVNNIQEYVYMNVKQNKNLTKIYASTLSNVWICAEFNKTFLYKICFFIKSIILLVIIINFKFFIGLIIILISFITFLLLRITNSKIQKYDLSLSSYKQKSLELFNNIQQGTKLENNISIEKSLKDKYFGYVDSSIKINNKISLCYNINNNFISLLLKSAVFLFTIYLIGLIKTTALTLSLYLILTPYLTSSAENLIAFFELFPEIGIMDNALKEFDSLKFQTEREIKKPIELSTFNLCFSKVNLNSSISSIQDVSIYLPFKSSTLFYGETGCGKRAIYLMLSRKEKPTSGFLMIDNKNLFDLEESQFNQTLYFTSKSPYFYNMSIYENLFLVCNNRNKILKTIKSFGLKPELDNLPDGINTSIKEDFNKNLLYLLGIVRAYLSGAKIICIYEVPESLSKEYKNILTNILSLIQKECSIVMFSHNDKLTYNFTQKFFIENNKIKTQKSTKIDKK